jgi:hypothetical protein
MMPPDFGSEEDQRARAEYFEREARKQQRKEERTTRKRSALGAHGAVMLQIVETVIGRC